MVGVVGEIIKQPYQRDERPCECAHGRHWRYHSKGVHDDLWYFGVLTFVSLRIVYWERTNSLAWRRGGLARRQWGTRIVWVIRTDYAEPILQFSGETRVTFVAKSSRRTFRAILAALGTSVGVCVKIGRRVARFTQIRFKFQFESYVAGEALQDTRYVDSTTSAPKYLTTAKGTTIESQVQKLVWVTRNAKSVIKICEWVRGTFCAGYWRRKTLLTIRKNTTAQNACFCSRIIVRSRVTGNALVVVHFSLWRNKTWCAVDCQSAVIHTAFTIWTDWRAWHTSFVHRIVERRRIAAQTHPKNQLCLRRNRTTCAGSSVIAQLAACGNLVARMTFWVWGVVIRGGVTRNAI